MIKVGGGICVRSFSAAKLRKVKLTCNFFSGIFDNLFRERALSGAKSPAFPMVITEFRFSRPDKNFCSKNISVFDFYWKNFGQASKTANLLLPLAKSFKFYTGQCSLPKKFVEKIRKKLHIVLNFRTFDVKKDCTQMFPIFLTATKQPTSIERIKASMVMERRLNRESTGPKSFCATPNWSSANELVMAAPIAK